MKNEALKNENVELNNKVSELQSISDKYDESVSEFELKEQNEKLYVIIKRVDSIEKAYKLLYEMK